MEYTKNAAYRGLLPVCIQPSVKSPSRNPITVRFRKRAKTLPPGKYENKRDIDSKIAYFFNEER